MSKTVQLLWLKLVFFTIIISFTDSILRRPHVITSFLHQCTQYGCIFTVTFNLWMVQRSSSGHSRWRKCWKFGGWRFVNYVFTLYRLKYCYNSSHWAKTVTTNPASSTLSSHKWEFVHVILSSFFLKTYFVFCTSL